MTRIVLSGACGRMGRVIAGLVRSRYRDLCEIAAGVDLIGEKYDDFPVYANISDVREKADVVVDFSHPSTLTDYGLLSYCKINSLPLVLATTGYGDGAVSLIKTASAQIPIFFTFNMSLGINLLQDLVKRAVRVLGGQFDVEIIEKHHNRKKDAPSGTAIMLAESVNEALNGQKRCVYDRHNVLKPREKDEIGIHTVRGGTIVGEHEVIFAGHDEIITLSHSALSREVFAVGALNAALFLAEKEPGLYGMSDLLGS